MSPDEQDAFYDASWRKSAQKGRLPTVQKAWEGHPAYWPTYQACLTALMGTYPRFEATENAHAARSETEAILAAWPDGGRWLRVLHSLERVRKELLTPAAP